jgi:hypothetical protein
MVKEAEIDALYSTPPADFVAARNELVKRARAAKQDVLARELAALRKPHAVVWLVNQLARRHPAQATALLEVGEELREAQRKALRGAGTAALRDANQAWRDAVSRALKSMRAIAGRAIEEPRIVATLLGAAADPQHAKLLERGRLVEEVEPPGIESALGALGNPRPVRRRERSATRTTAAHRDEHRDERQRQREAAKARRAREREAAKAQQAAADAERTAARLEGRSAEAAKRAAEARAAAQAAKRRAQDLQVPKS